MLLSLHFAVGAAVSEKLDAAHECLKGRDEFADVFCCGLRNSSPRYWVSAGPAAVFISRFYNQEQRVGPWLG